MLLEYLWFFSMCSCTIIKTNSHHSRYFITDSFLICLSQWNLDLFPFFVYLFCTCERRKYFTKLFFSFDSIKANTFLHMKSSQTTKQDKLYSQIMIERTKLSSYSQWNSYCSVYNHQQTKWHCLFVYYLLLIFIFLFFNNIFGCIKHVFVS
jgi:hypothetical protein